MIYLITSLSLQSQEQASTDAIAKGLLIDDKDNWQVSQ